MLPHQRKANDLDLYLELDLNKAQCRLRSYALGGMPYLERVKPLSSPDTRAFVGDVIAGRLTPAVLEMFDAIDVTALRQLPCFVTDRRQSIAVESSVTLGQAEVSERAFRVHHVRSPSLGVAFELDHAPVGRNRCASWMGDADRALRKRNDV
jgi:hypothetical protein